MKIANFDPTYSDLLGGGVGIVAGIVNGQSLWKPQGVVAATTAAGTLATSFEAGDTVDGIVLVEGDRLLVKDQAAGAENGVYIVQASGAPVRAPDFDSSSEIVGAHVSVIGGTTNAATVWNVTNTAAVTLGTTVITFAPFVGGAGASSVNVSHLITATTFPIIAHRGDINPNDGYPEDTIEAHRQAMTRGAHGVEFGVQRDADGTWQVIHDTTVDRTTDGTGTVASKTTAQMAALNIDGGYGYDAGRHGTSLNVATLDQMLDAILPYDPIIQFAVKETTVEAYTAIATYIRDNNLQERSFVGGVTAGGYAAVKAVAPRALAGDNTTDDLRIFDQDTIVSAAFVQGYEPLPVYGYHAAADATWDDDETTAITNLWAYGARGYLTNDLPNALTIRNEVVLGIAGAAGTGSGEILISDTPAGSPLVFGDLIQNEAQTDLVYADV